MYRFSVSVFVKTERGACTDPSRVRTYKRDVHFQRIVFLFPSTFTRGGKRQWLPISGFLRAIRPTPAAVADGHPRRAPGGRPAGDLGDRTRVAERVPVARCAPVYGPPKTRYNRFVRWARKGVWERVFMELAAAGGPPETLMLDATHVKAHRSAAGGKGGHSSRQSGGHVEGGLPKSMRRLMSTAAPGG